MRRFFATTPGQIVAIIICSTAASSLLFLTLVSIQNSPPGPPWPWAVSHRIVSLVNLLDGVPERYRERASLLASAQQPNLLAAMKSSATPCTGRAFNALSLEASLRVELREFPDLTVASCDSDDPATDIQVVVPMGSHVLEIRTGNINPSLIKFNSPGFGVLLLMLISVAAMSTWATWRVVRPLRRLSEKVDDFSRELFPMPISEEGPPEIQRVARALNLMQQRIARSMQERTQMLTAINHDLRTPLTRMRLMLQSPDTDVDRQKLLKNIDLMQTMTASALAFLREGSDNEAIERVDLDALLSTLCDEYAESGVDIRYDGPGCIPIHCRPNAFQRAVSNLIDNAIHFGDHVTVSASAEDKRVLIEIADDGPGVPPERLSEILAPFVRLDVSRSHRPGSIGLGLSIVNEVVQAHRGVLTLANRQPSGLVARIELPGTEN